MFPISSKRFLGLLTLLPALTTSCTDFMLNSSVPGDAISARTLDYSVDIQNVLEVIPRGTHFNEPPVRNCDACGQYSWKAKYGFVALNTLGMNMATDGLNERGLSAAYLRLLDTVFSSPQVNSTQQPNFPIITSICTYLLGNFATVDEVKQGLTKLQLAEAADFTKLYNKPVPRWPFHVSVHDAVGKSLVIEILNGTTKVYDNNENPVLTNEPPFEQMQALFKSSGANFTNLPGMVDPISRFQRASVHNHLASNWTMQLSPAEMDKLTFLQGNDEQRSIANAMHVINAEVQPQQSHTHWSLVRDHARGKLYVQSAQNQVPRRVELKRIDFSKPSSRHVIPVTWGNWFVDITAPLQDPRNNDKTMDIPLQKTN